MYLEKPSRRALTGALLFSAALGALPLAAQVDLMFSDFKRFQQVAPSTANFLGGALNVEIWDGNYVYTGCFANGGFIIQPPVTPGCPIGTTGLVIDGDIDGDGMSDMSSFWSIVAINRAQAIEPFLAHRLSLYSSPSPDLPKPLTGFRDASIQVFYNVLNPPSTRYRITRYAFSRPYGAGPSELNRMRREVRQGTYTFMIPRLNPEPMPPGYPQLEFALPVNHDPPLEAWPGKGVVPTVNDWILQNDANWRNGRIEIDPRVFFRFNWRGFNPSTFRSGDNTRFSLVDPAWFNLIVYPPYPGNPYVGPFPATPVADRAPQLMTGATTGIELPPLNTLSTPGYTFAPGLQLRAILDFRRNAATSGVARDTSRRLFEWDVFLIDTYSGYAQQTSPVPTFPPGTPANQMAPSYDFDGDGWTNFEEFALQTDPSNAASVPIVEPYLNELTDQIILDIPKRPHVGDRVLYQIQYSYDRINWTTILPGDPVYLIEFNNDERIRVRSRRPSPPENSFLRVRISPN